MALKHLANKSPSLSPPLLLPPQNDTWPREERAKTKFLTIITTICTATEWGRLNREANSRRLPGQFRVLSRTQLLPPSSEIDEGNSSSVYNISRAFSPHKSQTTERRRRSHFQHKESVVLELTLPSHSVHTRNVLALRLISR